LSESWFFAALTKNCQIDWKSRGFAFPYPKSAYNALRNSAAGTGSDAVYLTVRLTHAKVVTLRDWVANVRDPELTKYPQQHQVDFTNEKIEWITTGSQSGTVTDGPSI